MYPHFLYPLLVYRSLVLPFLVLSAIAVACWLIFRLYRVRSSGQPIVLRREILLVIFVVYLAGLASATLTPNHSSRQVAETAAGIDIHPSVASLFCSSASLPRDSTARSFCVRNARGNFLLFVPLGILIPLVWRRLRFWRALLIAIAVSVCIELVQYLSSTWVHRTADVNDVILNGSGACLGLLLVTLWRSRHGTPPERNGV